jgi:2-alkenal reductase
MDGVVIVRTLADPPAPSEGFKALTRTERSEISSPTSMASRSPHGRTGLGIKNVGIGEELTLTVQRDGRSPNVKLRVADISQLNQA